MGRLNMKHSIKCDCLKRRPVTLLFWNTNLAVLFIDLLSTIPCSLQNSWWKEIFFSSLAEKLFLLRCTGNVLIIKPFLSQSVLPLVLSLNAFSLHVFPIIRKKLCLSLCWQSRTCLVRAGAFCRGRVSAVPHEEPTANYLQGRATSQ